jgi:hypothetical protein
MSCPQPNGCPEVGGASWSVHKSPSDRYAPANTSFWDTLRTFFHKWIISAVYRWHQIWSSILAGSRTSSDKYRTIATEEQTLNGQAVQRPPASDDLELFLAMTEVSSGISRQTPDCESSGQFGQQTGTWYTGMCLYPAGHSADYAYRDHAVPRATKEGGVGYKANIRPRRTCQRAVKVSSRTGTEDRARFLRYPCTGPFSKGKTQPRVHTTILPPVRRSCWVKLEQSPHTRIRVPVKIRPEKSRVYRISCFWRSHPSGRCDSLVRVQECCICADQTPTTATGNSSSTTPVTESCPSTMEYPTPLLDASNLVSDPC